MTMKSAMGRALRPALSKFVMCAALSLAVFPVFADTSKISRLANEFPGNIVSSSYYSSGPSTASVCFRLSGTSMATPVVSGAVADLIQQDPTLTPDTIKARLMKSAFKSFPASSTAYDPATGQSYTSYYDIFTIFTIGAGYLDIASALSNHDIATASSRSPRATYNQTQGQAYLVHDSTTLWGNSNTWGHAAFWGTAAVWGASGNGEE